MNDRSPVLQCIQTIAQKMALGGGINIKLFIPAISSVLLLVVGGGTFLFR